MVFRTPVDGTQKYANEKGIQIVGDIPIFTAFQSSDVWAHPDLFRSMKTFDPPSSPVSRPIISAPRASAGEILFIDGT